MSISFPNKIDINCIQLLLHQPTTIPVNPVIPVIPDVIQ